MGEDKAGLVYEGETLLVRAARRLGASFAEVLLADGAEPRHSIPGIRTIADPAPDLGPLAGLVAGLRGARFPLVYLWGADMPFFEPGVALALAPHAAHADVVALRSPRGVERLGAFYSRAALPAVEGEAASGRLALTSFFPLVRVRLLAEPEWRPLDPDARSIRNVNRPEDYRRLLAGEPF